MNRYDDRARLVFHFAREEGSKLGHAMIAPEHLLLGLMREGGTASKVLGEFGATLEDFRRQVENMVGRGEGLPRNEAASITPRTRRVMELAGSEARSLGSSVIATEHVLLGIIREGDGVAYRILQQLTRDPDTVRWRILSMSEHSREPEASDRTLRLGRIEDHFLRLEHNFLQLREELTLLRQLATTQGWANPARHPKPKTVYYGVKYFEDGLNNAATKRRLEGLEALGFTTRCALRDLEDWGTVTLEPAELMRLTFDLIDGSDLVLLDLTEKGVGLGIEAGYAHAQGKPVVTVAEQGADLSTTLQGISERTYLYSSEDDLAAFFSSLRNNP